jgi:cob(I)alamin adenosyltransferase
VRVYTRTGDAGTTALADGHRVPKSSPRVVSYGDVDELNAALGVLRSEPLPEDAEEKLARLQEALFSLGAFLADPAGRFDPGDDVRSPEWVEHWIDAMDADLEPLRHFILPAGCRGAALAHHARTVCRRAERSVVALGAPDGERVEAVIPFLNRVSDALFVLARWLNARGGVAETQWQGRR